MVTALTDRVDVITALVFIVDRAAAQEFREAEDGVERSADFVAHVGEKLALGLVGRFGSRAGLFHHQALLFLDKPLLLLFDSSNDCLAVGNLQRVLRRLVMPDLREEFSVLAECPVGHQRQVAAYPQQRRRVLEVFERRRGAAHQAAEKSGRCPGQTHAEEPAFLLLRLSQQLGKCTAVTLGQSVAHGTSRRREKALFNRVLRVRHGDAAGGIRHEKRCRASERQGTGQFGQLL